MQTELVRILEQKPWFYFQVKNASSKSNVSSWILEQKSRQQKVGEQR